MDNSPELQIRSIIEIADRMIAVSEEGFASCTDDGCLLLNGMVRECAYRLRDAAELERRVHLGQRPPGPSPGNGQHGG